MSISDSSAAVIASALALVPLLGALRADAKPLPRIDLAAYCRSIQANNMLPGDAEQKYEGCLSFERLYLKNLETRWSSLSEKVQSLCVKQGTLNPGYIAISYCVSDIMHNRARALSYEEERAKLQAAPKSGFHE